MAKEEQIPNSRFEYYAENFGATADAGITSSQMIYNAIDPISKVRFASFVNPIEALNATNNLMHAIETTYEIMFSEAASVHLMRASFTNLADHIRKWSGKTLDQFLADEGLTVNSTYARIMDVFDEDISASNIAS